VQHHEALFRALRILDNSPRWLWNYLRETGSFPAQIGIVTPTGTVRPWLYHAHDLVTVIGIFCREDYRASRSIQVIVDVGSNIGLSALYFLTRNSHCRCYLYEPVPRNLRRMRRNLEAYEKRYRVEAAAVSDEGGIVDFGTEETGIYGSIGGSIGNTIRVRCLDINDVLESCLQHESRIDILKIDIEGWELRVLRAIRPEFFTRIDTIYVEAVPEGLPFPVPYHGKLRGGVWRLSSPKV
jgi:FkbM family methyltransferase